MLRTAVAAIGLTVCVFAQAQLAERPKYNVGDTWEWVTIDSLTKNETSRQKLTVVQVGDDIRLSAVSGGPTTRIWSIDGMLLQDATTGSKTTYKTPPRPWPLEVGKKWDIQSEWVNSSGQSGRTQQSASVVAFEEISTAAGKFAAFKIEVKGYYTNFTLGRGGRQDQVMWYSPKIGVSVRQTYDDGFTRSITEIESTTRLQ